MSVMLLMAIFAVTPEATEAIRASVNRAEAHREAYVAALEKERTALIKTLDKLLTETTKRGDLTGAIELKKELDRIRDMDAATLYEDSLADSKTLARVREALPGRWEVQLLKEGKEIFKSQWVFNRDGTVTSQEGAPRGRWETKLAEGVIRIDWSATAWETMWLPLGQDRTAFGESWSGATLRAKKVR